MRTQKFMYISKKPYCPNCIFSAVHRHNAPIGPCHLNPLHGNVLICIPIYLYYYTVNRLTSNSSALQWFECP